MSEATEGRIRRILREARRRLGRTLDEQRRQASHAEALPQLAVLGVTCGLLAAGVMIAFRGVIEISQAALLPPGGPENYENLTLRLQFLFPITGAAILAGMFLRTPDATPHVGIVHVLERLAYHQGRLPFRNALAQFLGAVVAIVSGMPVGREGPAVHLGAASASLVGQHLALPNNALRVLVGCGAAAAIAASFNTPLAGVAFAMEVVLVEYTVSGFAPVILAAVSATAVTRLAYGADPAFTVPPLTFGSPWEMPYVLVMGVAIGALAAAFIALVEATTKRSSRWPFWSRALLAGLLTGLCALAVPEIMGIGYDTVSSTLRGEMGARLLLAIVALKLLSTGAVIGLGIPGGLIGPVVVIGAAAGGAFGALALWATPAHVSSPALYALIGLGAMMAGTLHAPLAALTAMLELTGNPNIIWPGMLAVIAAYGVSRVAFAQQPVFIALMQARGLDYRNDPILQSLRRVGVAAVMDSRVAALPRMSARAAIDATLASSPTWILVLSAEKPIALLPALDLARQTLEKPDVAEFDLLEVPAGRLQVAPIPLQATLQEALDTMDTSGVQALFVVPASAWEEVHAYGVVTRDHIDRSYHYSR
ncbi:MAG TPA: chloride channel protein [Burkholderiales bacterium]|nr:chloride channel protein [Burkholderiales bacterium]